MPAYGQYAPGLTSPRALMPKTLHIITVNLLSITLQCQKTFLIKEHIATQKT